MLQMCTIARVCAQFPAESEKRGKSEGYCDIEATCFWLSIQPTNDLPGQFYVCLEEN